MPRRSRSSRRSSPSRRRSSAPSSGAAGTSKYTKAVNALARMKAGTKKLKDRSSLGAHRAGHAAVVGITTFGTSYAEGRFGEERLKVAGYDVRPVLGLVGTAMGVGLEMGGKRWGTHVAAAGEGVFASWAATKGRAAGLKARDKGTTRFSRDASGKLIADPSGTLDASGNPIAGDLLLGADLREIHLEGVGVTPSAEGVGEGVREERKRRRKRRAPAFERASTI